MILLLLYAGAFVTILELHVSAKVVAPPPRPLTGLILRTYMLFQVCTPAELQQARTEAGRVLQRTQD